MHRLAVAAALSLSCARSHYELHEFERVQLSSEFLAEGVAVADLDRDGHPDIVAGPCIWRGPAFATCDRYAPGGPYDPLSYSDWFHTWVDDVDGDGWPDVVVVGFPGQQALWYRNPGRATPGTWERFVAFETVNNEAPLFVDLFRDGRHELVIQSGGRLGWARADPAHPTSPWPFHAISPGDPNGGITHGLGVGDVNGDGRLDVIEATAWWEQPARVEGEPLWRKHEAAFGRGGAQMYAADVDGDGLPDVVTSLDAHGYGLAWYRQERDGSFRAQLVAGERPDDTPYGVAFSELHALAVQDVDGDGLPDLVTGKRYWAHGPTGDPGAGDPPVLYWFHLARGLLAAEYVPYLVDAASGVGNQVVVADVDGDGLPDVVVSNKLGTFVFRHRVRAVARATWQAAQPRRR